MTKLQCGPSDLLPLSDGKSSVITNNIKLAFLSSALRTEVTLERSDVMDMINQMVNHVAEV